MDWSPFGLVRRPFRPGAYVPLAGHEAAVATVAAAFDRGDGVALVDGPAGVGKTLAARRWLAGLPADIPRVVPPAVPNARPADLLQAILFDLERPYQGLTEQELRLAVTAELLRSPRTVLVLDEAQHLGPAAVEELRLLGNVETPDGAALFVLLVALPGLREGLPPAFAQRVAARVRIDPLTADESADYLRRHVELAGGRPGRVFDDEALAVLAEACGGIPRVLNQAATAAAELAVAAEADRIDAEAAVEAAARLGLTPAEEPAPPVAVKLAVGPVPAVAAAPAPVGESKKAGRKLAV